VWLGEQDRIPLLVGEELKIVIERAARADMKATLTYDSPIPAPIKEGQIVGKIVLSFPAREPVEVPVVAGASVQEISGFGRIGAAFKQLLWGTTKGVMPEAGAE